MHPDSWNENMHEKSKSHCFPHVLGFFLSVMLEVIEQ